MGILEWLASTALGQFFKGLFGAVLDGIDRQRAADALRERGRLEQKDIDRQAAVDALRRQQESDARPTRPTQGALDEGTF